jgi:FKBP-type peptidyl-prolyl cis-trans isomerase (trigger factor)
VKSNKPKWKKLEAEIDESAIDRTLDILRKQRRTFAQRSADQPAQDGDRVTVDFEGKLDGEPYTQSTRRIL